MEPSLTITDSLFLSEENSICLSFSNLVNSFTFVSSEGFIYDITNWVLLSDTSNLNPCKEALFTNSILSGDIPMYSPFWMAQS